MRQATLQLPDYARRATTTPRQEDASISAAAPDADDSEVFDTAFCDQTA
jgi:hypothetical protein